MARKFDWDIIGGASVGQGMRQPVSKFGLMEQHLKIIHRKLH